MGDSSLRFPKMSSFSASSGMFRHTQGLVRQFQNCELSTKYIEKKIYKIFKRGWEKLKERRGGYKVVNHMSCLTITTLGTEQDKNNGAMVTVVLLIKYGQIPVLSGHCPHATESRVKQDGN